MSDTVVSIEGREIKLTNLEKPFWPGGLAKAHLIKYYSEISPVILPHLKNRPLVMKRYPDGINGQSFYQKECPDYAPEWIKTVPVRHSEKIVNYIVCNDKATLVWLANKGCIEVHAWLSTTAGIDCPDIAVMDLDPAEGATFGDVINIALLVRRVLEEFKLKPLVKTSGSSGLHLFIPVLPVYSFPEVTRCMRYIAGMVVDAYPAKATVERLVDRRKGKVYLDYLQNGRGKTMAFQYSLRPHPGAPVSSPLRWEEVEQKNVGPGMYNINNIAWRIEKVGDLWRNPFSTPQPMDYLAAAAGAKTTPASIPAREEGVAFSTSLLPLQ